MTDTNTLVPLFSEHLEERAILRQLKTVSNDQLLSILRLAAFTLAHARHERACRDSSAADEKREYLDAVMNGEEDWA